MLTFLVQAADYAVPANSRLGVYILAAIVGIVVTGVIGCIKEIRRQRLERL